MIKLRAWKWCQSRGPDCECLLPRGHAEAHRGLGTVRWRTDEDGRWRVMTTMPAGFRPDEDRALIPTPELDRRYGR